MKAKELAVASHSQQQLHHVGHQNLLPRGMGARGPAACCSKTSKQANLVERKFCFISYASNWRGGWRISVQSPTPSTLCNKQGVRVFIDKVRGGLHAETVQSSLTVIFNWSSVILLASSWLFQVRLMFSSRVHLFPFLCSQFSYLWQLKSRQSGHHVVNFSTWGFSIYKTGYGSESIVLEKELKVLDYA